jgi:hypothetical protein
VGVVALGAETARADTASFAPELECGIGSRWIISDVPCVDLEAGMWFTENTHRYNVLLKFDLDLPTGAKVESATLHLNRDSSEYGSPSGELSVFEMLTPWTDEDTWESLGGTSEFGDENPGASDVAEDTVSVANGDNAWDVTDLVASWAESEESNYGLSVADVEDFPSTGQNLFHDSSASTAGLRPRLEVEYSVCPSDPYAAAQVTDKESVYYWNEVFLDVVRAHTPPNLPAPTTMSRAAAMLHAGIFDTMNSAFFAELEDLSTGSPVAGQACGWDPVIVLAETDPGIDVDLAVGIAARDLLLHLYPSFSTIINDAFNTRNGLDDDNDAEALGAFVADEVIAARSSDGSTNMTAYTPDTMTAGAWRATPGTSEAPCSNSTAVSPNWGLVTPFSLNSSTQARQTFPGGYSTYATFLASSLYTAQFNDVKAKGSATATGVGRTQDQEDAAWFWANDIFGTYKPPGQMLDHTKLVAMSQPAAITSGDPEDFFREWSQQGIRVSRLFAGVSIALADSAIAAWDQKYQTSIDLWRPYTAIREALTDGNANTSPDANWQPLSHDRNDDPFSPCFPSWVSGHATFGGTWSRVMENEFEAADWDDPFPLKLTSEDPEAVENNVDERFFDSFAEAGEENAASRIWLGVHFQIDADSGLATGREVADHVTANELRWRKECVAWACTEPIT